ncbi:ABC transporter ATPase [Psychromonas sp. CNPT3]|uniref:ABC transporter ATP-binding protein n=1 Tax=Psychromonas sp. CNPT3 TaxID=314282 RepID=UPI00006E9E41|nr:ATP-binding cassette domain-containing protein [Psychromonas sp. CNPT3]AGH82358.1 ABC transporter ATPase [Psychromonas sp. CNPT3]
MIYLEDIVFDPDPQANAGPILDLINLHVKKKEICILSGVSGSGKSSLLSIIGGLTRPGSGLVLIDQCAISKMPDKHASKLRQQSIGFIFQQFNLFDNLTVLENIYCALVPLKKTQQAKLKIETYLELVALSHKKNAYVQDLSGGEKQRCAIVRALVNSPKLLLADEPTANLDKDNSIIIINLLKSLNQQGVTVLIATHDPLFSELLPNAQVHYIDQGQLR